MWHFRALLSPTLCRINLSNFMNTWLSLQGFWYNSISASVTSPTAPIKTPSAFNLSHTCLQKQYKTLSYSNVLLNRKWQVKCTCKSICYHHIKTMPQMVWPRDFKYCIVTSPSKTNKRKYCTHLSTGIKWIPYRFPTCSWKNLNASRIFHRDQHHSTMWNIPDWKCPHQELPLCVIPTSTSLLPWIILSLPYYFCSIGFVGTSLWHQDLWHQTAPAAFMLKQWLLLYFY